MNDEDGISRVQDNSLFATKLDLLVPRIVCFEQLFQTLMQTLGLPKVII